ncbi:pseudouridine synthase [Actinomycetes bacterium]|nr:pseudouridine synthase [Actinomycetes bacterium]
MSLIRLQKVLADAGVASRRASEKLILDGRVSVDGRVIRELGTKINPINSVVQVDGEVIVRKTTKSYIAFNKPVGVLSTMSDPEGRPSLNDFFGGRNERLFHVGRLDKESEGLLLLTNDGELTHQSTHPSFGVEKTYFVEIFAPITKEQISELKSGIRLADGLARPLKVEAIPGQNWARVVIHEGRNQIVRRMFDELGQPVQRLVRLAFGPVVLGELPVGKWRELNVAEVLSLQKVISLKP